MFFDTNQINLIINTAKSVVPIKMAPKTQRRTSSDKAGLVFPVGRIERYLREADGSRRISRKASVALAGSLEYVVGELFEVTKLMMDNHNKKYKTHKNERIKPKHLHQAICEDGEFNKVFGETVMPESTFIPHLDRILPPVTSRMPRKSLKKKAASKKSGQKSDEHSSDESDDNTNHANTSHANKSHANTSHANKSHANTSHAHTSHGNTSHATPHRPSKRHASSRIPIKSHATTHHHSPHTSEMDMTHESPESHPRGKVSRASHKTPQNHGHHGHHTSPKQHQSRAKKRTNPHPDRQAAAKKRRMSPSIFDSS